MKSKKRLIFTLLMILELKRAYLLKSQMKSIVHIMNRLLIQEKIEFCLIQSFFGDAIHIQFHQLLHCYPFQKKKLRRFYLNIERM